MAKINPIKVKQEADKLEKAGKLDQAIVQYRQLVEDNPRDWNTINKIGDLFAKLNKIKEASAEYAKVADFYARDGFLLKAIAIWKKINKLDPTVLDPYVNLADLYGKQGLMMEAKSQYQIVVDEYVKRGRMREAGDVLKKMAEIDPADLKVRSRLADLYTREGNSSKAVDEHVAIAEELNKKGHLAEAVQVLEKGLKIDPKSHKLRLELGRIHLVQKNHERAAHFLEEAVQQSPNDPAILVRLGEAYLGAKKIEEAEAIFKRLIELNPQDQESRAQMGRVYLMQGQFDKAFNEYQPVVDKLVERREGEKGASLLSQITQKNPQHVKTLQKLVEIYRVTQNDRMVVSTYGLLSEAFINVRQYDQAASVLEILISLEPQNQQHKQKLQMVRGKSAGGGRAAPASTAAGLDDGEDIEFEDAGEPAPPPVSPASLKAAAKPAPPRPAAAPKPASARASARPTIELSGPLSSDDSEFIEEHLAEGRVFRKYGLIDKAADQFDAVIARFPDHIDARQELRDLYKEKGQSSKAAEQALALAEICRLKGDSVSAAGYEDEVRQLAPELAPAAAPARPAPPAARAAAPPPLAVEDDEEEISIEHGDEEVLLEVEESGLETPNPLGGGGGPLLEEEIGNTGQFANAFVEEEELAVPTEDDVEIEVDNEPAAPAPAPAFGGPSFGVEAEEEAPLTFDESEELPLEPPPPPPPPPKPKPAPPPVVAKPAPPPAPKPAPPPPPPPPPPVAKRPPAPPAAPALPADLQRLLDEVESYVSLGFVDDAREALKEVRHRYPSHPAVNAKVAELGLVEEEEIEAPPPPPPPKPVPKPAPPPPVAKPAPPPPPKPAPPPPPPPPPVAKPVPKPKPAPIPEPEPEAELDLDNLGADAEIAVPEDDPFASPEPMAADDPLGELAMDVPEAEPEPEPPPPPVRARKADQTLPPPPLRPARPPVVPEPEPEPELDPFGSPHDGSADLDVGLPDFPEPAEEPEREPAFSDSMSVEDLVGHASAAAPPDNHDELDLNTELGGLFETQSAVEEAPAPPAGTELGDAGLTEIFKEFKAGVDRQLGKEDYDTRYNLGIAYKEMGLVDEAIAEFQLAAKDERRALECSSMLGLCFMEKGLPKLAIKWFERGLKAPGRTPEEYLGLRYDLASAHEASGDVDTARDIFNELWSQNASFRDVAEKVRALGGA